MRILGFLFLLSACGSGGMSGEPMADAGPDLEPVDLSARVFDEQIVRTFRLQVAPAEWDWLNANERAEQYVPATLEYDGENFRDVAIRYKGSIGSLTTCFDFFGNRTCDKLSIKLKFNEYQEDNRFYGLKRINLHSMNSDATAMHDAIGYKLFRDAGLAASRTAFAHVEVNGESLGLYAVVEQVDGRFTRSRFPGDGKGNLYKEVWPQHQTPEPYLSALKTNRDEAPSADKFVRFAKALDEAGEPKFIDTLEAWSDVEQLVSYMAVARLIDHWDGTVGWYCRGSTCANHNLYWYESAKEDKLWLIPWDLDHTFEEPSPVRTYFGMPDWDDLEASCTWIPLFLGLSGRAPSCDPFLRAFVTTLWDDYRIRSEELLAGDFSIAEMNARIDELQTILADEVVADPFLDFDEWQNAVEDLRGIVEKKRDHVMAKFE